MTSPTIIQQPGAIDQAAGAFMQSYAMSRGLAQKRQELELEKQKVASQTALEGAQASEARDRAKKLEQEIEDTNNMQIGLRFAQAHLNNLDDDQAFAQDTASLDPVARGYAMSARDVLRQTRADIASKQAAAAMQQQEAAKMQADRERRANIDAGMADTFRTHQGKLSTIDGVQSFLEDAARIDPEHLDSYTKAFLAPLEGDWVDVHGDNGQLILVERKKGIVRNTGVNLGPRVAGGGAAGTAVSKEEAIAAVRTAIHAIDQMSALTSKNDNADVNPVLSAMVGGAGHIPVVGGAVSGATRPISQLLKSDPQQEYAMLAQQLLHNQASLMPRGQRSMPLLQSLMDAYIPPSGSSKATRYAARRNRLLLRRTYQTMLNEFRRGNTPDLTVLPGYKDDAQAAASEQTSTSTPAAPGALNYGDFRRGPQ